MRSKFNAQGEGLHWVVCATIAKGEGLVGAIRQACPKLAPQETLKALLGMCSQ